mgnify:CR=1 FL=1|jgi:hypothetical protein
MTYSNIIQQTCSDLLYLDISSSSFVFLDRESSLVSGSVFGVKYTALSENLQEEGNGGVPSPTVCGGVVRE